MKKKTSNLNTLTNSFEYKISSSKCGRDKNGVFHCKCGKCKPIYSYSRRGQLYMRLLSNDAMKIVNELSNVRMDHNIDFEPLIKAIKYLAECEELNARGQFIELPCRVGDKVYVLINDKILSGKLYSVYIQEFTKRILVLLDDESSCPIDTVFNSFGTTVFISQEEAERALERRTNLK